MRNVMLGLAFLGAMTAGVGAQAGRPSTLQASIQPAYWSGDYCGPRCQEHRWRRHERWEARRHWWHHRRWEERRYGYYAYPRY
jgi:hypothetical protein